MICNVARGVDRIGPKLPRSPVLIEHRPGHFNKGAILAFNNPVLLGNIWRRKLVFKTLVMATGFETIIFELGAIDTA